MINYKTSFFDLKKFIEKENFKGWDPYDGLNSVFFRKTYLHNLKIFRLIWIQFFKKSPINFREFLNVPKGYNSKGLALLLSGYCNIQKKKPSQDNREKIKYLLENIFKIENKGFSGSCWGYNFDWQALAFFQPNNTPTVIASTFVGNSLLDSYEILNDKKILEKAISIKNFILNDLNRTYDKDGDFCFSYSPLDKSVVYNASILGSQYLSRLYNFLPDKKLLTEAKKSINFCIKKQNKNGSWVYGDQNHHKWIDNFHTGFNLVGINDYQIFSNDYSFNENIERGFDFYINNFFTNDGKSKYFNNKIYPIDIHSPAQLIVTLVKLNKHNQNRILMSKVLDWTITNMKDKSGFFYYQKHKFYTNKIQYMRWSQAWMFYSLSKLIFNEK